MIRLLLRNENTLKHAQTRRYSFVMRLSGARIHHCGGRLVVAEVAETANNEFILGFGFNIIIE